MNPVSNKWEISYKKISSFLLPSPVGAQPWVFSGFWSLPRVPLKRSGCSISIWRRWGTDLGLLRASLQVLHSALPLTSAHQAARCQAGPIRSQPPPRPWLHTQRVRGWKLPPGSCCAPQTHPPATAARWRKPRWDGRGTHMRFSVCLAAVWPWG